jgi:putative ABC transport system permease protein
MPSLRVLVADPGFLGTFRLEVAHGRGFSELLASDSSAYLINEEAARQLGWAEPLGKTISVPALDRQAGPVIGVVNDFHFRSMREKIGPLLIFLPKPEWVLQYSLKIDAASMPETLKLIEGKWAQLDPEHPFIYSFFDEGYSRLYHQEQMLGQIVNYYTVIGLLLATIGLFSQASLTAEQRTKEIGIRKVIGASSLQIVSMFTRQYLVLVFIGFVVALPVALWVLNKWLETFAYHDTFSVLLIAGGCGVSMAVALLTVGFRAWQAANVNPVKSLRTE